MNVKELFENEALIHNIVESIEDLPEDTEVCYFVWALGYTADEECTDDEVLVGEFTDPDAAIKCAEATTLEEIEELGYDKRDSSTAYFSIEVETVIADPEDEDGGTMNIGTVYQRDLWIDGEYGSEEDNPYAVEDPIIAVATGDYELLDDGTLKLSAKFLQGFNKNDFIYIDFVEEAGTAIMSYKIISKVENKDGDYYHCELQL